MTYGFTINDVYDKPKKKGGGGGSLKLGLGLDVTLVI
jgi:hypothetical protein